MGYAAVDCFLIEPKGKRQNVAALWDGECTNSRTLHVARRFVSDVMPAGELETPDIYGYDWDGVPCDDCGALASSEKVSRSGGLVTVWNTNDGTSNHPGAMYFTEDYEGRCFHWDNCDGKHLHVVLPNGHTWDVDSRANNCDRKDDRLHRCWVRTGVVPHVTVGKGGNTCSAGAGSILSGDYHGFLIDGQLTASL